MTERTIEDRVISTVQYFIGNGSSSNISKETDLVRDYSLGFIDQADIILDLEDEFEIEIPSYSKVSDIIDYVSKTLETKSL